MNEHQTYNRKIVATMKKKYGDDWYKTRKPRDLANLALCWQCGNYLKNYQVLFFMRTESNLDYALCWRCQNEVDIKRCEPTPNY